MANNEAPKKLETFSDLKDWNEYVLINAANDKLSIDKANILNRTIGAAVKIRMDLPLQYARLKARFARKSSKKELPAIPWFDQSLK